MNSKFVSTLVIALASVGAANSFAADSTSLTRDQVRAEYYQAVKAGTLPANGDIANVPSSKFESSKTRAEVRAEYYQAVKAGTLPVNGDTAYLPSTKFESNKTRSQVQAEYLQARKDGTLPVVVTQ
jgi:hypothetical protein